MEDKNEAIPRPPVSTITAAVDLKEQEQWFVPVHHTQITDRSSAPASGTHNHVASRSSRSSRSNSDAQATDAVPKLISNCETMIHVLKGNIGPGLLALPEAFMNAGLWVGFAGIPIMGLICINCMHILVKSSKELCRRVHVSVLSYEETAELAFKTGPGPFRRWHRAVYYVIKTFLVITQTGFCCVFVVFISQNIQEAVKCMIPSGSSITIYGYMGIILVPLLVIAYIPNIKYLAPVSMVAGAAQVMGITICLYYMLKDLPHIQEHVPAFAGWSTLPLYFGSAIYAFEGIGLVLPLENKMRTPRVFRGFTGVLNTAMLIVVCLYACFGFFGYLRYGSTIQGSITLNLPAGDPLAEAVKLLMAIAVYLTYPLQMYVPYEILIPTVTRSFRSPRTKLVAEYSFRTAMVILTFIFAVSIPNIGLFISLIGAVSSSTLALIFPPIIELITFWPNTGKYHWILVKAGVICIFGIVGFVTGTISSVQAIVHFFKYGEETLPLEC